MATGTFGCRRTWQGKREAMSNLDILFWLLVALLAGIAFAIESGAAARNRAVVLSTLISVSASVIYIMFAIDDKTGLEFAHHEDSARKGGRKGDMEQGEPRDGGSQGDNKSAGSSNTPTSDDALENVFNDCDVCPEMVRVPAGSVMIGSPAHEPGHNPSEEPQVPIRIASPFAVARFEITRDQFEQFVKGTGHVPKPGCMANNRLNKRANWLSPGFEQSGSHPVVCITEADARAYAAWLSSRTRQTYRLLTEAEWEYVARAGSELPYTSGETMEPSHGNFGRHRDGTTPIGFSGQNAFGVYEVHGNAAELVAGCWSEDLSMMPRDGQPLTAVEPCQRGVIRGGSWNSPGLRIRFAARAVVPDASVGYNHVGFRVMREMKLSGAVPAKSGATQ
jgi:formylglycine-generating enzyme required for sulfatase activity